MQQSLGFLPPLTEETLHQGRTFFGPDTGCDFGPVVEAIVVDELEEGAHGTGFRVVAAVDDAVQAAVDDGAGTWGTVRRSRRGYSLSGASD